MKNIPKSLITLSFLAATQICLPATQRLHHKYLPIVILQGSDSNGNYLAKAGKVFMYSKPNQKSVTTVMLPGKVVLVATKKSGDFVFGSFNTSSEKQLQGWFRLKDLTEIKFVPPKVVKK